MLKNFIQKNKWLIIPVEVKDREFESRLLLALYAIKNGYKVIFGDQREVLKNLNQLPRGIYFDKSISKNKTELLKEINKKGFILTCIDEEGYPYNMESFIYWKQRVSAETLDLTELFFTWGEEEKDAILNRFTPYKEKIVATGNPRIDLWTSFQNIYSEKAGEYRKRYGKYILMPSNFGANHINGLEFLIKQGWDYGFLETEEEEKAYRDFLEMDKKVFEHFAQLLEKIASNFPDYTVILRPHPSEDINIWQEKAKHLKNVVVIYEGTVTPWILGCDLLIHSSCTTGLEAFLMGKPIVSFLPLGESKIRAHVSDQLGFKAFNENEGVEMAQKALITFSSIDEEKKAFLNNRIAAFSGKNASENIIEELEKLELKNRQFNLLNLLILKLKKIFSKKTVSSVYNTKKFSGSSKEEIQVIAEQFANVDNRLQIPEIYQLDTNLYILYNPRDAN